MNPEQVATFRYNCIILATQNRERTPADVVEAAKLYEEYILDGLPTVAETKPRTDHEIDDEIPY